MIKITTKQKLVNINKDNIENIDTDLIINSIQNFILHSDENTIPKKHLLTKLDLFNKNVLERIERINDNLNISEIKIKSFDKKINEIQQENTKKIKSILNKINI